MSAEMVETSHGQVLVAWAGDRTKTPILTYHDLGLNHTSNFQAFFNYPDMAELTQNFCVFHVNAPGQEQGALSLARNHTYPAMDDMGEQIQEVLNHFSLGKYVGLGVGLGANVLLRHALAYPERVDCLLLVNATSNQAGWIEWGYQKTQALLDYLMWHHFGPRVDERAHDLVSRYKTYFETGINSVNLGSLAEQYIARTDINLTRTGETLKVPVLNVVGGLSPFIEESVTLNGRLEPSKTNWIKIKDTAMVLEERPDEVCQAFRLFLQGRGYCVHIPWFRPDPSSTSMSQFVFPPDQPVVCLDPAKAFIALTPQEQRYSHFLSRASWYGGLIVLLQTSPESPHIFRLIHNINTGQKLASLKAAAFEAGVTEEEVAAYFIYCSGFYANMGNYKTLGDTKFVPNLPVEKLEEIVKASAAWKAKPEVMEALWNRVKAPLYSLKDQEKQLGLGDKGITKYFTPNCTVEDSDKVIDFFKAKDIMGLNNRVIKTEKGGKTVYEIRHAGVENMVELEEEFRGDLYRVTVGDYQELLAKVVKNIEEAAKYAANNMEEDMLTEYADSFRVGCLNKYFAGFMHWINNNGPNVEIHIGFTRNKARDPAGMRGEFEGFVGIVNKEKSAKLKRLVDNAKSIFPLLPWPEEFEKDQFLSPDFTFTSLDVLTFGGSGVCPDGINMVFKNLFLCYVISSSSASKTIPFISAADNELFTKFGVPSSEVQVGLHELFGHGSGKLFFKDANGVANFHPDLKNPLNGEVITCWYEAGETHDSKFTSIASSFEECRAEAVALHLSLQNLSSAYNTPPYNNVLEIFGHSGPEAEYIKYVNWLSVLHGGLTGLEMFSPYLGEWKQAHSQGRFVIMQVLLEAGDNFVKIEEVKGEDGKPDLLLSMDRSKLESVGRPAIKKFLLTLQVQKSTGDIKAAKKMYMKYSQVAGEGPWAARREIVIARKTPRRFLVQGNTVLKNEKVFLVDYPATPEGLVQSWADRFPDWSELDQALAKLAKSDEKHWPL